MIGAPPVLTLRSNFARPSPAQVAAFAGVPTGFVVDAMNGLGRGLIESERTRILD
jgi:4-hydroxy-4-methyl-2-oxoglutarate aldolase